MYLSFIMLMRNGRIGILARGLRGRIHRWITKNDYQARLAEEIEFHADYVDVSALPAIAGYWASRYVRPWLQELDCDHPDEFAAIALIESARRCGAERPVFASLGAGNCDTEARIAKMMIDRGFASFRIECVDINPAMLERGRALAAEQGLAGHVIPVHGDFNDWGPGRKYQGILANQSLHHVLALETLFDRIAGALDGPALFAANDMIGRNGHMRWPEALDMVRQFWQELPESYRYNRQLKRMEREYESFDCSQYGFEGVRAQDILPLLVERFHFHAFIAFGNVVDIFVDRSFGHNFQADAEWDRNFIDRVHACDEQGFRDGRLTPTHMIAAMGLIPAENPHCARGLSPRASIRQPGTAAL
jgi:SAM-dependent methyltransferase